MALSGNANVGESMINCYGAVTEKVPFLEKSGFLHTFSPQNQSANDPATAGGVDPVGSTEGVESRRSRF
jgi:hypothetical protein